eukprot:g528.t1
MKSSDGSSRSSRVKRIMRLVKTMKDKEWVEKLLRNHRVTIRTMKSNDEETTRKLPQSMRGKFEARRKRQHKCLEHNGDVIRMLLKDVRVDDVVCFNDRPSGESYDDVGLLLIQVLREWTVLGKSARSRCSQDILSVCESVRRKHSGPLVAIVPGSGLARLAFDIATKGFDVTGIECSRMMATASRNILSMTRSKDEMSFFPYAIRRGNTIGRCSNNSGIYRKCMFPDIHTESLAKLTSPQYESSLTIFQGAFGTPDSSLYIDDNSTNILATCFFVDCVPDLVGLIKEARRILKPGGTWVNFGPLKYHQIGCASDRLTWDEFVELISLSGFRVVTDEIRKSCLYLPLPEGAMDSKQGYNCGFFHAIVE